MSARWYTHWNLSYELSEGVELSFRDPDIISSLIIETEAVRKANEICKNVNSLGISSRYYFVGSRGYGKSTILNYMTYLLHQQIAESYALPVYCVISGGKDEDIETMFFKGLLEGLFDVPSDVKRFGVIRIGRRDSLKHLEEARREFLLALKKSGKVSSDFINEAFTNQINHVNKDFQRIVFLIDGLDKHEPRTILKFLRESQEQINSLITRYNCIFIHSADPTWIKTLDSDEFSGVKGMRIDLRSWSVKEAEEMMRKRLERLGVYFFPFDDKALERLVEISKGNPRFILQNASIILHYAARQHEEKISIGIVKAVLWSEQEKTHLFDKIRKEPDFRSGVEKLKKFVSDRQFFNILKAAFTQKSINRFLGYNERANLGITVDDSDFQRRISTLLDQDLLKHGIKEGYVQLEDDVRMVMKHINEKGLSFDALPAVFDELETRITELPLPAKDEVVVKEVVESIFKSHVTEWLSADEVIKYALKPSRWNKALKEKFGDTLEAKLKKIVPMVMGSLNASGLLLQDRESRKMRWKGSRIDENLSKNVRYKNEILEYEKAKERIEDGDFVDANYACKKALVYSIDRIVRLYGLEPSMMDNSKKIRLLKEVGINVEKPLTLENLIFTLEESEVVDEIEVKMNLEVTKLYLIRLHRAINELTDKMPKKISAGYLTLHQLESKLRECICIALSEISQDWWRTCIPPDVRESCEERKAKGEKYPWLPKIDMPPIYYANFADYRKIITKKDNWRKIFKDIFGDEETISAKLKELELIRNKIAHSKKLFEQEFETLKLYARDIISMVENWLKKEK